MLPSYREMKIVHIYVLRFKWIILSQTYVPQNSGKMGSYCRWHHLQQTHCFTMITDQFAKHDSQKKGKKKKGQRRCRISLRWATSERPFPHPLHVPPYWARAQALDASDYSVLLFTKHGDRFLHPSLSQRGLPALICLPVPPESVGGGPGHDDRRRPAPPVPCRCPCAVIGGALLGVR